MDDETQKPPTSQRTAKPTKLTRDQALAQALRDNLKRRKQAASPAKKDPA